MNLAVGSLASMSDSDYYELLKRFKACPSIQETVDVVNQMDLDFPRLKSMEDFRNTLKKLTSIFKEIASAWSQCPGV